MNTTTVMPLGKHPLSCPVHLALIWQDTCSTSGRAGAVCVRRTAVSGWADRAAPVDLPTSASCAGLCWGTRRRSSTSSRSTRRATRRCAPSSQQRCARCSSCAPASLPCSSCPSSTSEARYRRRRLRLRDGFIRLQLFMRTDSAEARA